MKDKDTHQPENIRQSTGSSSIWDGIRGVKGKVAEAIGNSAGCRHDDGDITQRTGPLDENSLDTQNGQKETNGTQNRPAELIIRWQFI